MSVGPAYAYDYSKILRLFPKGLVFSRRPDPEVGLRVIGIGIGKIKLTRFVGIAP
jgi:hypothetical protein